jgi:hypothetical protein
LSSCPASGASAILAIEGSNAASGCSSPGVPSALPASLSPSTGYASLFFLDPTMRIPFVEVLMLMDSFKDALVDVDLVFLLSYFPLKL